jgi:hypothetical protein
LAVAAFGATQAAAAAAGLAWMVAEWLHRGKPTAVGLATGIVAGLVAVTPASGYVPMWAGLVIGLLAGLVCYTMVCLKSVFKYDDSLDAFGVHGVGGFLGAVLTGVFCLSAVNPNVKVDGLIAGNVGPVMAQIIAAVVSTVFAFGVTFLLVKAIDMLMGFTADPRSEIEGLDRNEHGEVGFDEGRAMEMSLEMPDPRPASVPPNGDKRFTIVIDGPEPDKLVKTWAELCQVSDQPVPAEFKAVYPYLTTVQGNRFRFRGGNPETIRTSLTLLFRDKVPGTLRMRVES